MNSNWKGKEVRKKLSNANNSENSNNDIFEEIEKESQRQSGYINLQVGEIRILQFDLNPDKIKLVTKEFSGKVTKKVQYQVIDTSTNDGEKILEVAIRNAMRINSLLKRGETGLEIERIGSGKATIYNISAA